MFLTSLRAYRSVFYASRCLSTSIFRLKQPCLVTPVRSFSYMRRNFSENSRFDFEMNQKVCCIMRGIPFNITEEEIYKFFESYNYLKGSLIIGVDRNNRRTGFATILFENTEEMRKAVVERQGKVMRHRWVELFENDFSKWKDFTLHQKGDSTHALSTYITHDNKDTIVALLGIPFQARESDILEFMKDFAIAKDDIVIGKRFGKSAGKAIVFLKDRQEVHRAEKELDMKYIGNRYIQVRAAGKVQHL
ncbi:unnamed protein product [Moneuplotes crassus]|uniref:RRM domain-containing protein n=1 Tax=Euplotes crassus TaxID=5936 RepID=A0AAD1XV67_EUPCR|nr:unnamed protein product [Moneuplotes crassus]